MRKQENFRGINGRGKSNVELVKLTTDKKNKPKN